MVIASLVSAQEEDRPRFSEGDRRRRPAAIMADEGGLSNYSHSSGHSNYSISFSSHNIESDQPSQYSGASHDMEKNQRQQSNVNRTATSRRQWPPAKHDQKKKKAVPEPSPNHLLSISLHSEISIDTVDGTPKSPRTIKLRKSWQKDTPSSSGPPSATPYRSHLDHRRQRGGKSPSRRGSKSPSRRASAASSSIRHRRKLKAQWPPKIKSGASSNQSSPPRAGHRPGPHSSRTEELRNIKVNVKQRRSVFLDPTSFETSIIGSHMSASAGGDTSSLREDAMMFPHRKDNGFPRVRDRRRSFETYFADFPSMIEHPDEDTASDINSTEVPDSRRSAQLSLHSLEELVDRTIHVAKSTEEIDSVGPEATAGTGRSKVVRTTEDFTDVSSLSSSYTLNGATVETPVYDFTLPSGQKLPKGSAQVYRRKRRRKKRRTNYRIRYDGPTSLRLEDIYGNLMVVPEDEFSDDDSLDGRDRFRIRDDTASCVSGAPSAPPSRPSRCPHTPPALERKRSSDSRLSILSTSTDQAPTRPGRRGSASGSICALPTIVLDAVPVPSAKHRNHHQFDSESELSDTEHDVRHIYLEEDVSGIDYFGETNDPHRLEGHRPDIWVTPVPSPIPDAHKSWKVKRVWNVKEVDEQEYEHNVKNEDLFNTVKSLLGAEDVDTDNNDTTHASEAAAAGTPWHIQKFVDVDGQVEESETECFLKEEDMKKEVTVVLVEECRDEFVCDREGDDEMEGVDDAEVSIDEDLTDSEMESFAGSTHRERAFNRPDVWVARPAKTNRSWKIKREWSVDNSEKATQADDVSKVSLNSASVCSSFGNGWTSGLSGKVRHDVKEGRLGNPNTRDVNKAKKSSATPTEGGTSSPLIGARGGETTPQEPVKLWWQE